MVGYRDPDEELLYPVDDIAARHGASVASETADAREAYSSADRPNPTQLAWP
jgi:hypothetical protein